MSTRPPSTPSSNAETWLDAESVDPESAHATPAVADSLPGTTLLDAYAVDRVLGEGGMGRIYEAHHIRLPAKRFAVKALRPELLTSPNVRARFEREVEAVSRITHPGVVSISDVGTTSLGVPFMVCEHLSGLDLLAYLRRFGPLSNERTVYMGCRIAEALEAAHAQGVIHRDIKPSNVFLVGAFEPLGPEWERVKIIDFGLSRISGRDDQLTATGIVMGTPAYMSPEQARGARTDLRTDVYGLGAVLYAAATGVPPFREKTPQQTLLAVMGNEPVRPRELVPGVSEGVELVIQRAMSKEPEHRYPSMSALRLALAQLELATSAGSSWQARPVAAEPRSVRARFAALVVGTLALGAGAIATLVQSAWLAEEGTWTPLERAALVALAAVALAALLRALRRFRARVWSNTATLTDALPRLEAPLFAGLLTYTLTSIGVRLAGEQLLELARVHTASWSHAHLPAAALPAAAALLCALGVAAHQTWWVPMRPIARWLSVPALAALLALAALAEPRWRWPLDGTASSPAAPDRAPVAVAAPLETSAGLLPATDRPLATTPATGVVSAGALPADGGAPRAADDAHDAGQTAPLIDTQTAFTASAPIRVDELPPAPPESAAPAVASLPGAAANPPLADSPEALKAEVLAHARRPGEIMAALRGIERLLAVAPSAGADPDVRRTLRFAANIGGEPNRLAFQIMSSGMGSHGPDLLYHIMLWQPALADKAKFLLSRHRVRELFSPELAIAYDLRFSPSCSARLGLMQRASEVGDQRTINALAALVSPTPGCGEPNHPACLDLCEREAPQFARTVDAIVRRIRSSERAASAN